MRTLIELGLFTMAMSPLSATYDSERRWKNMESISPSSYPFVSTEDFGSNNIRTGISGFLSKPPPLVGHSGSIEETEIRGAIQEMTKPWWDNSGRKEPLLQLEKAPKLALNATVDPIHSVGESSYTWLFVVSRLNHRNCLGRPKYFSPPLCASINDWSSDRCYSIE